MGNIIVCKEYLKIDSVVPPIEFIKGESYEYFFHNSDLLINVKWGTGGCNMCLGEKFDKYFFTEEEGVNIDRFRKLSGILKELEDGIEIVTR